MNTTNKVDMHLKGANVLRNPEFKEKLNHWKAPLTVVHANDRENLFDYVYFDSTAFIEQKFTRLDAGLEAWIWLEVNHISPQSTEWIRGEGVIIFYDAADKELETIIFNYRALPGWQTTFSPFMVPAGFDHGTLHIKGPNFAPPGSSLGLKSVDLNTILK
ncbi:hypothetical protein [Pseudomonas huaxiensis]|uniref:hypothetical protein n=1 Tax=Pseudomonas huaxiensis TaxID=2213017 RepID=UPI000DA686FB|nr:hypothetical protein [Pseudomonas huaxiensis]